MNKHDRAKLLKRLYRYKEPRDVYELLHIVAREVDRAVRAERKKCREADKQLLSALRRADARLVDGMKKVGRKRT